MNLALDPVAYLRATPPFDELSPSGFGRAAGAMEISFHPAGTKLLVEGGPPSSYLNVIRKGLVRFQRDGQRLLTLEEGEMFGFISILSGSPPYDVVVEEDLLSYRIPAAVFRDLLGEPAFARQFTISLVNRLRSALAAPAEGVLGVDLFQPVDALLSRPPVWVSGAATVGEAARVMRAAGTSSVLVDGDEAGRHGILTDRDLRNRVLAEGRGPEGGVREVASFELVTVPSGTPLYRVWEVLLTAGVHHLPVEKEGRLVGVVTDTDLLRHHSLGPVAILKNVERLSGRSALAGYATDVARMAQSLFLGGLDVPRVGSLVALVNDALARRLLRWAEADLGPPPCAYAWIVFGSEGRMEQTLLTDQDNALIHAEDGPEARAYFESLARKVVDDLLAAGFPPCPGGFMATGWRGSLSEWQERFRGFMAVRAGEDLVNAASFFDFRKVHGELDLEPLQAVVDTARQHDRFRAHLVNEALAFRPPIGAFGRLRGSAEGIDLKRQGLLPLVGLARVYALEAGVRARGTLDRLAGAASAGTLSADGAETMGEAFGFFLRLRLREQLRRLDAGETPDDRLVAADLSSLERAHLKEAFRAVRHAQEAAALRYRTDRF